MALSRPYLFKLFKGCLPQGLLGPFLNSLSQLVFLVYWVRRAPTEYRRMAGLLFSVVIFLDIVKVLKFLLLWKAEFSFRMAHRWALTWLWYECVVSKHIMWLVDLVLYLSFFSYDNIISFCKIDSWTCDKLFLGSFCFSNAIISLSLLTASIKVLMGWWIFFGS